MTQRMIRADLERMLDALDNVGEFGAACFVSMAIDALGGSAASTRADDRSTEASNSTAPRPDAQAHQRSAPGHYPVAKPSPRGSDSPSA